MSKIITIRTNLDVNWKSRPNNYVTCSSGFLEEEMGN